MIVKLVLFAKAKELAGANCLDITLGDGATVGDLKSLLAIHHPELTPVLEHCTIAVDQEYASDERRLYHGCEVGCIPPVSGG